mmetsp:Transcript_25604/g.81312  ORF Transcript_25604/g.81312 Transcript_25604/m.81312 type:complete len:336 (+) Transcript_25604:179-1186(+)
MPTARAWSSRCGLEKERAGACVQGLRLCRHQCANARPRGFQPNPPGGRLSGHSGVRLGARRERPGAGVDLLPLVLQVPHAAHDAHDGQDDRRHRVRERLGGVVGVEGADAEQQGRDADHDGHLGHDRQHDARVGEAQAGQRPAQLAVGLHAPRHLPVAALHGVVPRSHRHEVCVDGPSRNRQGDDLPRRGHQSREEEDHHGVEVQQAPESTVCVPKSTPLRKLSAERAWNGTFRKPIKTAVAAGSTAKTARVRPWTMADRMAKSHCSSLDRASPTTLSMMKNGEHSWMASVNSTSPRAGMDGTARPWAPALRALPGCLGLGVREASVGLLARSQR